MRLIADKNRDTRYIRVHDRHADVTGEATDKSNVHDTGMKINADSNTVNREHTRWTLDVTGRHGSPSRKTNKSVARAKYANNAVWASHSKRRNLI